MRVIVTGGTGFIGGHLVNNLANDGHEVIVLSRNPHQSGPIKGNVQFVKWDGRTADGWGQYADGADAIVNLAGESIAGEGFLPAKWTDERKRAIRESRNNAGAAVVAAVNAATNKPKAVIQSSAVGYYGTSNTAVMTEDSPAGNDFLAGVCKEWEASTAAVEAMGVRRAIARTGIVLSFESGALPRMAMPFKLFAGGPLGSGKQPVPWIHIEDEVRALRFLVDRADATGPFNLTAPAVPTNAEFSKSLGRVMGRPSFMPAPGFAFNLAFGEVAEIVLEGQKAIPKRLQEMGFTFNYPDLEVALADLQKTGR